MKEMRMTLGKEEMAKIGMKILKLNADYSSWISPSPNGLQRLQTAWNDATPEERVAFIKSVIEIVDHVGPPAA
jgi:hypothetical protein